jgi:hypothetical protein
VDSAPRPPQSDKELLEKLGGKDPCPCGSGRLFPPVLPWGRRYDDSNGDYYVRD